MSGRNGHAPEACSAGLGEPALAEILYREFAVDGLAYIGFPRDKVLALAQELIDRFGEVIELPTQFARRAAKTPTSSRTGSNSLSIGPDAGDGADRGAAASVPAAPPVVAPPRPRRAAKTHEQPILRRLTLRAEPPLAGTLADSVLTAILAAGEEGIDLAGIVKALYAAGIAIEAQDEERAVGDAVHHVLRPRGLVERALRNDLQSFWKQAAG